MIELKNFLKIFCLAIFVVTLMAESVFANPYPDTLDSGNLVCVYGERDIGYYADRSSVKVQMYDPPHYQISIRIFPVTFSEDYYQKHGNYVGGPYQIEDFHTFSFRYNFDRKVISYQRSGTWVDWDVNRAYSPVEGYPLIPYSAEVAFVSVYNRRFFDTKTQYVTIINKNLRVISEDFYRVLNI